MYKRQASWLNPDAAEFVPVLFVRDPDPVISSSSTQGYEKSLEGVALPSPVEINLVIAHEPGQLDSSCLLYTSTHTGIRRLCSKFYFFY